jgi:predicted nucleotide-binding protein
MPTDLQTAPASSEKLLLPRNQTIQLLSLQMEKGKSIRSMKIRSAAALERGRDQKLEWIQITTALLLKVFHSDTVAEDFNTWQGKVLPEYADLRLFIEHFFDEMEQRLRKLQAILQRVEAEPDVIPRLAEEELKPTGEQSGDAAAAAGGKAMAAQFTPRSGVLIVHDRDEVVTKAISQFIRRLGFELLLVYEQPDGAREALENFSQHPQISFAMLLISVAGIAATSPEQRIAPAFRQAAFELGYCSGKLGPGKVCVLFTDGPEEVFQDEFGIQYIPVDSADGWQLQLAKHLKRAHIELDLNRVC